MTDELTGARARLREIESSLAFEIQRAMNGFREQFGVPITDISVHLTHHRALGSEDGKTLASVRCSVTI